jgi:hypothetical protein
MLQYDETWVRIKKAPLPKESARHKYACFVSQLGKELPMDTVTVAGIASSKNHKLLLTEEPGQEEMVLEIFCNLQIEGYVATAFLRPGLF